MRRRKLLVSLAATAATTAGLPRVGTGAAAAEPTTDTGGLLVHRVRDAMLGLTPASAIPPDQAPAHLARALAHFHAGALLPLAARLPSLITTADTYANAPQQARVHLLTTRILIKLSEPQLAWIAADRARRAAEASGDALVAAEATRNLVVLARKAHWHTEALDLAMRAADSPDLRATGSAGRAARGLLLQTAAYVCSKTGDVRGMRQLTNEAAALAEELPATTWLPHGGTFDQTSVTLYRVSAENSAGNPAEALAAARTITPEELPTAERRARFLTDIATAHNHTGHRDDAFRALLAAEHHAPDETRARPAVRLIITSLLASVTAPSALRALAGRCGVR